MIQLEDLREGEKHIKIEYEPTSQLPRKPGYYSTRITNISSSPVRIQAFAGYRKTDAGWLLDTVTGDFYSEEEFLNWYGMEGREWIGRKRRLSRSCVR